MSAWLSWQVNRKKPSKNIMQPLLSQNENKNLQNAPSFKTLKGNVGEAKLLTYFDHHHTSSLRNLLDYPFRVHLDKLIQIHILLIPMQKRIVTTSSGPPCIPRNRNQKAHRALAAQIQRPTLTAKHVTEAILKKTKCLALCLMGTATGHIPKISCLLRRQHAATLS